MSTVLITGAGRGIGLACVKRLAAGGFTLYAGARSDRHVELLSELRNVVPVPLDVSKPTSIADLDKVLPGRLDGVVHNAGIVVQGPVESVSTEEVRRLFDVNVVGMLGVTQAVLPRLRRTRGRVAVMSSLGGRVSTPGIGAYCASKFAVEALADALRVEIRPWDIRVCLIEPGPTRTDMWTNALENFDSATAGMREDQRSLYGPQLAHMRKFVTRVQKMASPPEAVAKRVEHALTSRHPRRRYLCGNVARAQVLAKYCLPTSANDNLLSRQW